MNRKFWHFDTDVYKMHVGLYLGELAKCDPKWLQGRIKAAWPGIAPSDDECALDLPAADEGVYADSLTVHVPSGHVVRIVRIPQFRKNVASDHAVLAHETLHLAASALAWYGVKEPEGESEALAYLFETVYARFLDILYKANYKEDTDDKRTGVSPQGSEGPAR